ncbi:hypothetical protein EV2_048033 [Malus domestica]
MAALCCCVGEPSIRILILYHLNPQTVEMNLAFHSDVGNWQHYAVVLSTWGTRDLGQVVLKWGSEVGWAWPKRRGKRPIPMMMRWKVMSNPIM